MTATARQFDAPEDPSVVSDEVTEDVTSGARAQRSTRPHLRMVAPLRPERASRGIFALVVVGMLGIAMVIILVLNTSLAQGAFTVSELRAEQAVLSQQEQALTEAVAAASTPETLERQARALGMVPSESPVFLSVPDGTVLGRPKAAAGARSSVPRLLTPADATVTEAVDNQGADFPVSPGADYDPAAADAAALQAKAAADEAAAQAAAASATSQMEQPATAEEAAAQDAARKAAEKADAAKAGGKKGAGKKAAPVSENTLWEDSTVLDVSGQVSTGDAGLVAVPVR